ncbi:mannonate dehydratase, partial [bacterium]|nr:mannonate dehydratase [bacterium]
MLVNPFTEQNLALAAQVGVKEVVLPYQGPGVAALQTARHAVEAAGMRLTVLERKIPHRRLVHRLPGWEEELAGFKSLLRDMAEVGMQVACYNWMPAEDWQRTTCTSPERGGSRSTAFDLSQVDHNITDADGVPDQKTSAAELWDNLERFLNEVLPVAEACGVSLALHPDDPPLTVVRGQEQIITSNAALRRVVELAPSPANGLCYCTGSLFPAGEDLVAG